MADDRKPALVYLTNVALLSVLLTVETWFFTIYHFLAGDDLPKQVICASLSVIAAVFLATVGRKAMGGRWPIQRGQQIALTGLQACWVTVLMMASGIFYWWMGK